MTLAIAWAYVRYGQLPRAQALLYGIKPVILAFLKADLVDRAHWLTQAQLLDAVAVGQVTPGPVFTTATFIGYLVRGWPGALLATAGIFLPSFLFVGCLGLVLSRLRKSPKAAAFLDGVNAGALALMASVTWTLSRAAVVDPWTAALGLASAVLLIRFKPNPTWLVLGGGLAGCLVQGLMR
jgi:chromate transporter